MAVKAAVTVRLRMSEFAVRAGSSGSEWVLLLIGST